MLYVSSARSVVSLGRRSLIKLVLPSLCLKKEEWRKRNSLRWMSASNNDGEDNKINKKGVDLYNDIKINFSEEERLSNEHIMSGNANSELNNDDENVEKVSPHLQEKFVLFDDEDADVVLDIHEEFQMLQRGLDAETSRSPTFPPEKQLPELNLRRGITGVYDIADLVEVLRAENARDICVIEMPQEMSYADHLVLVSGRSRRHLLAMAEFIKKLYKKKRSKGDTFVVIQGEGSNWLVLDMGNIVLHLLMPEQRSKYDIETLWSVGVKYDDESIKPRDPMANQLRAHLDFLNHLKPLPENETTLT